MAGGWWLVAGRRRGSMAANQLIAQFNHRVSGILQ